MRAVLRYNHVKNENVMYYCLLWINLKMTMLTLNQGPIMGFDYFSLHFPLEVILNQTI